MNMIELQLIPFSAFYGNAPLLKLHRSHRKCRFIVIKPAVAVKDAKECKQKQDRAKKKKRKTMLLVPVRGSIHKKRHSLPF